MTRLLLAAAPLSVNWTLSWFGVWTFVNTYVAKGLRASTAEWTAVTLWFPLFMVVWLLAGTELTRRYGRRRILLIAMTMCSVGYPLIPLTRNLHVLSALLALEAAMGAAAVVVWFPMVAAAGGDRPGRNLAMAQWVAQIVAPLALLGGGWLVGTERWRLAFSAIGGVMLVCTGLFAWWSAPLARGVSQPVQSLFRMRWADIRELVTGPFILVLLAGACVEPFNFHTMNQLWPNLARDLHGTSEPLIATVVALSRLPAVLVLLLMAAIIDRVRPAMAYGLALIAAAAGVLWTAGAGSQTMAIVAYFGFYCGHAAVWGSNSAATNAAAGPRLREPAFAVLNVAMISSVWVVGLVHNRLVAAGFTLPAVFRICAGVAILGGAVLILRSAVKPLRAVNPAAGTGVQEPTTAGEAR